MNLDDLKNKTILLLGKSRAFSSEEFASQLKFHNIITTDEYTSDVASVIEGRMMTPYEQIASDDLYENKGVFSISIDVFEKELAKEIDEDTLLMSLKLSHDKERLKSFLQNTMIRDEFFLRLLKLYSWDKEDFFENDDNRDVTAALIARFFENIERNHNVQYATSGLMHLLVQTKNPKLIEAIAILEPLAQSLKSNTKDANYNIITAIATHYATPKSVLKMFIKKSNAYVKTLIAMRDDCDSLMQDILYKDSDAEVLRALTYNSSLDKKIIAMMIESGNSLYISNIAKYISLDDELFKALVKLDSEALAHNESLSLEMQEGLIAFHKEDIKLALASNTHLHELVINELISEGSQEVSYAIYANISTPIKNLEEAYENSLNHISLAYNENTPACILKRLSSSTDAKVLMGLAKNLSTPIDIMYQLQLDSRFERAVKTNESFGKHIQSENIGWEV